MKANKQRLPAFTILELTIAMLISAVVIGLAYTTFTIISNSFLGFNRKHSEMAVLLRLDELLRKDFAKSKSITSSSKEINFKDSTSIVTYTFEPDYVLRMSTIADTFKVKTTALNTSFAGKSLSENETVSEDSENIDELSFQVLSGKESFPYHYYKHYSSQDLFKPEPDAGN